MEHYFTKENLRFKTYGRSDSELLQFVGMMEDSLYKDGLPKGMLASAAVSLGFELCDFLEGKEDAAKAYDLFMKRAGGFVAAVRDKKFMDGKKSIGDVRSMSFSEDGVRIFTKNSVYDFSGSVFE